MNEMKKLIILVIVATQVACQKTTDQKLPTGMDFLDSIYFGTMRKAMENDPRQYKKLTKQLIETNASNPFFHFHRAKALLINNEQDAAIEEVAKFLAFSPFLKQYIVQDTVFDSITSEQYQQLLLESNSSRHYPEPKQVVEIANKGFAAEGITIHPKTHSIFLGSIRKGQIIARDTSGVVTDFIRENAYGIQTVLGLDFNKKGNELWACVEYKDTVQEDQHFAVFVFNESGELIKRFQPNDTLEHELNDLVIAPNGEAYVTDSKQGGVFRIFDNQMELFIDRRTIGLTNGITLSDDGQILYVADVLWGVLAYNRILETFKWLAMPDDITLCYIDGLSFYNDGLIAHQFALDGIFYYQLSNDSVIQKTTLVDGHYQKLRDHTTGHVLNDTYYFIANSDIDIMNQYGHNLPEDSLTNPLILQQVMHMLIN